MNLYSTDTVHTHTRELMQAHFITHNYRAGREKRNASLAAGSWCKCILSRALETNSLIFRVRVIRQEEWWMGEISVKSWHPSRVRLRS